MIKIVADENIAQAYEAFSTIGEVKLMPGREIDNDSLKDADALITRSITRVDASLLKNTRVKFAGTATIGTDHIDLDYLKNNNITFADAKGCNADAVAEYVFSAVYAAASEKKLSLKELSIGIIGAGNIGSRVARIADSIGMEVKLTDPPLKRETGNDIYRDLGEVLDSDIVTIHVPLTFEGTDKTFHLINVNELEKLKSNAVMINSSRGEVVNGTALLATGRTDLTVVLDVWENEPLINKQLLEQIYLATPHIAGYSLEGKINGTVMIYNALCRHLNVKPQWQPQFPIISNNEITIKEEGTDEEIINNIIASIYNIRNDDAELRKLLYIVDKEGDRYFDLLRKNYPLRREFTNFKVKGGRRKSVMEVMKAMGVKE